LEFLAIGPAEVEFVAREANGNGIACFPLAGSVALGSCSFVFPGVDHALEADDNSAASGVRGGFAKDLGFGLVPVLGVTAFEGSALVVELSGAASNGLLHLRRVVPRPPRHIRTASLFQDC
jgi:hypothetical protein